MSEAAPQPAARPAGELKVIGTSVTREIDLMFDRLDGSLSQRPPVVLQVGSRTLMADRNERNWRGLIARRFGARAEFLGIDLEPGSNVDCVADICASPRALKSQLGERSFDLVICNHVLEHTVDPKRAAQNIEALMKPGGLAYIATPWSQAFHAAPDDYWRFSLRGLALIFSGLQPVQAFYSGGDVGLDVAYRVERNGRLETSVGAGAVEQGLFQLVLDHEDNRALLSRQASGRLPVSRTYMPTLFVNLVGQRQVPR
ncbi:MAG: methyltransferase domain-containing protein [Alphaproteobacteria bacterium]|nr:methyltransferase domain-containing protein [Alphaproteobacteria bacterium]